MTAWYRIDKDNGAVQLSNTGEVVRAAYIKGEHGGADIKAGRFETTSAIFSRADQLDPSEMARKTPVRCLECGWLGVGWHLKAEACPVCDGRVEELIAP